MSVVHLIAGVDEVGRGPLVGDVVAAAVILPADHSIAGLTDSKKLSARRREALDLLIREQALAWHIDRATHAEIDKLNILHASMLAMKRAVEGLRLVPTKVLVDGNRVPEWSFDSEAIVGGDAQVAEISAASILAKVCRDREMIELDKAYPEYGFARHKGYPTREHMEVLARLGPTPFHRQSFAPVRAAVAQYPLNIE